MRTTEIITLLVRIGVFQAHVHFMFVPNMAVDCILGTTSPRSTSRKFSPVPVRYIFNDAPPVALVGSTSPAATKTPMEVKQKTRSRKLRLARGIIIPPMTQTTAMATTPTSGLCFLQNHPKLVHKHLALMAQGVMDIISNKTFTVMVRNVRLHPIGLLKNTITGLALPAPAHIFFVQPSQDTPDFKKGDETPSATESSLDLEKITYCERYRNGYPPQGLEKGCPGWYRRPKDKNFGLPHACGVPIHVGWPLGKYFPDEAPYRGREKHRSGVSNSLSRGPRGPIF